VALYEPMHYAPADSSAASTANVEDEKAREIPIWPSGQRIVCTDSNHDSLPELIFSTGTYYSSDPWRIEFWQHQGWNRFKLVYADTGAYPEPSGITTGNAVPSAQATWTATA